MYASVEVTGLVLEFCVGSTITNMRADWKRTRWVEGSGVWGCGVGFGVWKFGFKVMVKGIVFVI